MKERPTSATRGKDENSFWDFLGARSGVGFFFLTLAQNYEARRYKNLISFAT